MNGAEVDIIARVPGKHKPVLLIEIKAGVGEDLQESQAAGGAYEKTAAVHGIPLVYIIPENYSHADSLPKKSKIIFWNQVYALAKEFDNTYFCDQIENFVEFSAESTLLEKDEIALLACPDSLRKIFSAKELALGEIDQVLIKCKRDSRR